jgi:2-oxoglutarate ferredoxin oxidoreductase subunit delta
MSEPQKTEQKDPVWVIKERCKVCEKCIPVCPTEPKVLALETDKTSIYGQMLSVVRPDLCINCFKCENVCPDFAIFVAKKKDRIFPKRTKDAAGQQSIVPENNEQPLPEEGDKQ